MTPARIALLVGALVLLVGAVWLVFVGAPPSSPRATAVAGLPSPGASLGQSPSESAGGSSVPLSPSGTTGPNSSMTPAPLDPLLKEVPAHSVDPAQLTGYIWPVKHALISGRFAARPANEGGFIVVDGVPYHDGVDLVTHCDDKVRAAHDGTVLYAGRNYDPYLGYQGNAQAIYDRLQQLGRTNEQAIVVVVDDGNGYRSVYVHLNEADVQPGAVVHAGDFTRSRRRDGLRERMPPALRPHPDGWALAAGRAASAAVRLSAARPGTNQPARRLTVGRPRRASGAAG